MFPEIALKEFKTCEFITARLKEFGFDEVYSGVGGTGVVAILRGRLDESILLRADIDALSLTEKAAVPYASTIPGMMHACGHDAHAAMLLGVAKTMITRVKDGLRLNRGIKFCFQPGEENTNNGAGKMISDKTLHDVLDGSPRVK
jgi:amidohydrolase